MIRIASFDIGKNTFSYCVEDLDKESVKEIVTNHILLNRRNKKKVFCNKLLLCGKIVLWETNAITDDNKNYDRKALFSLLESKKEIWERCDQIVIEQQLEVVRFKQVNIKAIKIGEATLSWFIIHFPDKQFEVFGSSNKTRVLNAPKKLKSLERKKWAVEKARELLVERKDDESLKILEDLKKRDDVSDCFLQLQAWKLMRLV